LNGLKPKDFNQNERESKISRDIALDRGLAHEVAFPGLSNGLAIEISSRNSYFEVRITAKDADGVWESNARHMV